MNRDHQAVEAEENGLVAQPDGFALVTGSTADNVLDALEAKVRSTVSAEKLRAPA